jgi:glycosyltransferase involved in cell wall biosynthesis
MEEKILPSEKTMQVYYSVVVPVFNEDGNIENLNREIKEVMNSLGKTYEVIYINDGSTDDTLEELKKLKKVKIISLNRNYGQATALDAGFKASLGEIIISMDGDLQNDPKDIPKLLSKLEKDGLDVVTGWRKIRKDKSSVRALTKIGRSFRKFLISDQVHDTGCTLRVYKKEAVKNLDLSGEMHRYILALLRWKGFTIGEIEVNHRPRACGKTKYTSAKAIRGFIDLLYIWFIDKYSQRPLHIFGSTGLLSFFIGLAIEIWMIYGKIFKNFDLSGNAWFVLGFFLIITGILLFSFGIAIDLLMKIHLNTSPFEKRYNIREIILK